MNGVRETNFDGLVGPTHNYAGLSDDNVASMSSRDHVADPRAAALEGIAKMRTLVDLGCAQAFLPPHERPHVPTLRRLGFHGDDAAVLRAALRESPRLLAACSSASAMWAANAATVTPSSDSHDGRVHFTPANLIAHAHRSIEAPVTTRILRAIFPDTRRFRVHEPLPATASLGDEGAANHVRLGALGRPGVQLLVYGRRGQRGMGRHVLAASEAIARSHGIATRTHYARQHPKAIAAGAFHNDVVAVGRTDLLFCHERSYVDQRRVLARLRAAVGADGGTLRTLVVPEAAVPLPDAIRSYLFNAQLVADAEGRMTLVVPAECHEVPSVARWLEREAGVPGSPIERVVTVDVRQSMRNGGGPACLRLCVPLSRSEAPLGSVMATPQRLDALELWVRRHYRDRLSPEDLADPALLDESRAALEDLTRMLGLGDVYDFQRGREGDA